MKMFATLTLRGEGSPDVLVNPDGQLQIYPTGIGGPCFFATPDDWRELVAAVDAVIER